MSYTEASFEGFGQGLNLRDRPDTVSEQQALDALNVTFTEAGAVKQRDGNDALTGALTNAAATLCPYYTTGGTNQIVAGCGTRLEAIATNGTVVASATGLTTGTWGFARFGTPGNEVVYAGQGDTNLNKWDGSAWTTAIASTPEAGSLCVMPVSNRLVAARFNNTTGGPDGSASSSSPSHVYFSDAGAPETWTTTNFIRITPGDGEKIQAVVAWDSFVFIFKETKFAVVYGESTDSGGDPVFDYDVVDSGVGALGPKAVVAGTDGVYFAARDGVYRTQRGTPEKISDLINPIFDSSQPASDYYLGGTMLQTQAANTALGWHNKRLYVGITTTGTSNDKTFVHDPAYGWWSLFDFPGACFASWRISSTPELMFGDTTNKKLYRHNATLTNDDGMAITSRWRSGWTDFGSPDRKRVREWKVWGGSVEASGLYMAVSGDFDAGTGTNVALDLTDPDVDTWGGTQWGAGEWSISRALIPDLNRTSAANTVFSVTFSNSTLNNVWSIHRLTAHLAGTRISSVINA